MGWTSYYRRPGETDREHLQREVCGASQTIIDSTTIKGTFYAAVRVEATGEVYGLVVLQQRGRGQYNYYRKEISETMGPNEAQCPVRILDLLSPTESQYAIEWRETCRVNAENKANQPKVAKGDTVRFDRPLNFTNIGERDTFTLIERSTFRTTDGYRVRIPSWRDLAYEINVGVS